MTSASSLAFPGSRTLAGWWRQLAPLDPVALWVGYLFVHRVEARFAVLERRSVDRLAHFLLQAVDIETRRADSAPPDLCKTLVPRMNLQPIVIKRLLHDLTAQGLLSAQNGASWTLTSLGRHALTHESYPCPRQERRVFSFAERLDPTGRRVAAPHFVDLAASTGATWEPGESERFDVQVLRECLSQPDDWKMRFGFPGDVTGILEQVDESSWLEVVVDRTDRVLLAIVQTGSGGERLLGLAARPDGWILDARTPIFDLPSSARSFSADIATDTAAAEWSKAWQTWCQVRNLPASEAVACHVTCEGASLKVAAPARLVQRLQAARSDIFLGEAWLLAGDGYLRAAACLTLGKG